MTSIFKKFTYLFLCAVLFLGTNLSFGQTAAFSSRNDTITFNLQRIAGIGPNGFISLTKGSYQDLKDAEDFPIFPQKKNIPPNLSNVSQWLHFFDEFQFYYQNYVSGVLSKPLFFKKAATSNWVLADTINMSAKPLKCSFTVLAGTDSAGNEMYLVDANNNDDYSDDVVRPLLKNVSREDQVIDNAIRVKTNYVDKGVIRPNEVLVFIQRGRNQKLDISVAYPQFDYLRVSYKGSPYIIFAMRQFQNKLACVIPDRPYFSSLKTGVMVTAGHFINISGDNFKLINYDFNTQTVTLKGPAAGFAPLSASADEVKATSASINGDNIVSDQVGFIAPAIKGNDINPLSKRMEQITLSSLRGKYVFVDFWSTYCAPCIAEFPFLNATYKKYSRDKLEIIGVFDERSAKLTRKLFTDNKVAFPNILMNNKSTDVSGYGHVESFPTNYLIDPAGKIIGYNLRHEDLMNKLKALIGF